MKLDNKKGYSILELILILVIIAAASVALAKFFLKGNINAKIKNEQEFISTMVEDVYSAYRSASDFSTISSATVAGLFNLEMENGTELKSKNLQTVYNIIPTTRFSLNDSFEIRYSSVSKDVCIQLTKALYPQAYSVTVENNPNLISADGNEFDVTSSINHCSANDTNTVSFRYHGEKNVFAANELSSCICSPDSEVEEVACPTGQNGTIKNRRTASCTGGTADCPTQEWSSWVTVFNGCNVNGLQPTAPTVNIPTINSCVDQVERRVDNCPTGHIGGIINERTFSCAANTWGPWAVTQNSCVPSIALTCSTISEQQIVACPSGMGGQVVQERSANCDAGGNHVWGDWRTLNDNCTAACVAGQNCCQVSFGGSRDVLENCAAGYYGLITHRERESSTCPSSTGAPVWAGNWTRIDTTNNCQACPAPATEERITRVTKIESCPTGQSGTISWTSVQRSTRVMSYNCPSGTTVLPIPDYTNWTPGVEIARENEVNTCAVPAATGCYMINDGGNSGYSDAGSTYKDEWSWWDSSTGTGGTSSSEPTSLMNACELGSTARYEWDDGFAGGGTNGYINYVCYCPPQPDCNISAGASFNWTIGGNGCSFTATSGISISYGGVFTATDTTAPTTGTGVFSCESGGIMSTSPNAGATCNYTAPPASCNIESGRAFSWTVGGNVCNFTTTSASTINSGTNLTANDATAPTTGTAAFNCNNGTLSSTANSGATCSAPVTPSNCSVAAGRSFSWTVGGNTCSYSAPSAVTVNSGSNYSATDSTAPTTGSAAFNCNNGTLSATANSGATCTAPANCSIAAGRSFSWTVGSSTCSASASVAATLASGSIYSITDNSAPTTGSAAFNCNNGTLSATANSGATCTAPANCSIAAGRSFSWTVGSSTCTYSAPSAVTVNSGSNYSATDSTAPTTGTAAFNCNNGTISSTPNAGATCNQTAATKCVNYAPFESGTIDASDAYYDISYTIAGVNYGCYVTRRDHGTNGPSLCNKGSNGILDELQWQNHPNTVVGDTYSTDGSQFGWEQSNGEAWGWERDQITLTSCP